MPPSSGNDFDTFCDLIRQARGGSAEAQGELMVRLEDYARLMADRATDVQLRSKVGPSDILQQSMVNVVRDFSQFRGHSEGELKVWLKEIIRNQARKARRDLHRDKRDVKRERPIDEGLGGGEIPLPDVHPTPGTDAASREQRRRLGDAIRQLPDDYAEVIRLRSLERQSFKTIAAQMNRTEDAVTKLWLRALLKLKTQMAGEGREDRQ